MKTILIATEGYSGSSRKSSDKMFQDIDNIVKELKLNVVKLYQNGSEIDAIRDAERFIKEQVKKAEYKLYNIAIIGKSMGAAKSYFLYKELFEDHSDILNGASKILVFTIDPHGKCARDFNPIPFSSLRNMKLKAGWTRPNVSWVNIFQQNKYPKGAKVVGATFQDRLTEEGIDHFNITENDATIQRLKYYLGTLA
jgi:hypothetical protein